MPEIEVYKRRASARHTVRYTYAELVELLKREHPEARGREAWVWGLEQSSYYKSGDERGVTLAWDVEGATDGE